MYKTLFLKQTSIDNYLITKQYKKGKLEAEIKAYKILG